MKKLQLISVVLIAICIGACKKQTVSTNTWIDDEKIFISGALMPNKACYWNKDKTVEIDNANIVSNANKVIVDNNTVYIAGSSLVNNKQQASFWYNSGFYLLAGEGIASTATDICVINQDVYVCGYITKPDNTTQACFWKNGELNFLSTSGNNSKAIAMAVHNGDIYIAGSMVLNNNIGVVWKNGDAIINLPDESNTFVNVTDIAVNNLGQTIVTGSRYFANGGNEYARYWINDVEKNVFGNTFISGKANAVFISENNGQQDVHIVGTSRSNTNYTNAFYSKNDLKISLDKKADNSDALDISVQNGISYILGYNNAPCYWKNGVSKIDVTPDGSNNKLYVSSIFVLP